MTDPDRGTERNVTLIIGLVLVVLGVSALLNNAWFPWFVPVRAALTWARHLSGPLMLILLGGAILYFSQHGGQIRVPARGTRLYRSRSKKMVSGVVGGLSDYLGVDVTVLRLIVVALAVINFGGVLIAYIIASVVIPLEPAGATASSPPPSTPPRAE